MQCRTPRESGAADAESSSRGPRSLGGRAPGGGGCEPSAFWKSATEQPPAGRVSQRDEKAAAAGGREEQEGPEREKRRRNPARSGHPNRRGPGAERRGRGAAKAREEVPGGRPSWPGGGRAPAKRAEPGGTGEAKRGVGAPDSRMGKSYANSALPRANQGSPSARPRDWLAPREEGPERPGIPALRIQVHAGLPPARATRAHPHPARSRSAPCRRSEHKRVCVCVCARARALRLLIARSLLLSQAYSAKLRQLETNKQKMQAAAKAEVAPDRSKNQPLRSAEVPERLVRGGARARARSPRPGGQHRAATLRGACLSGGQGDTSPLEGRMAAARPGEGGEVDPRTPPRPEGERFDGPHGEALGEGSFYSWWAGCSWNSGSRAWLLQELQKGRGLSRRAKQWLAWPGLRGTQPREGRASGPPALWARNGVRLLHPG